MKLLFSNTRSTNKRGDLNHTFDRRGADRGYQASRRVIATLVLAGLSWQLNAANWIELSSPDRARINKTNKVAFAPRLLATDPAALRQELQLAATANAKPSSVIQLPMPDGSTQDFWVTESPMITGAQAHRFPDIKTYKLHAVDAPAYSGRVSMTSQGFHAYLDTPDGTVLIDPVPASNAQHYRAYYREAYAQAAKGQVSPFQCAVHGKTALSGSLVVEDGLAAKTAAKTDGPIKNYRIAIGATGEYSQAVADAKTLPLSDATTRGEIVVVVNRVNQIYERDLGVHLNYVIDESVIYTDANADPYSNNDASALLSQNQAELDFNIGSSSYDIGHVFSTGGGGLASLGVVCESGAKARGVTGLDDPVAEVFYIDFVAHEIGHQFDAEHTFNGTSGACSGNRNSITAFEPGSGTTVMSYAGICDSEDLAPNADAMFHAGSIAQISNYTRVGQGSTCSTNGAGSGNVAPVVSAGNDFTIPGGTYFELSGSATDADSLLYRWEGMDTGGATNVSTIGTDLGSNALFRSFLPDAAGNVRSFPNLQLVLSNTVDVQAETLPIQSRSLNFRLTASDGNGGVDGDDMCVVVDGTKGPFALLQPDGGGLLLDSSMDQVIEWNAACTELAPVSCANIDILFSDDSGASFSPLLTATPNDGEATVNFGPADTAQGRIKLRCSDNIFFDISATDFSVGPLGTAVLSSTGNGGSNNCGTATIIASPPGAVGDVEPNDSPATASPLTLPASLRGTVNDSGDTDDFYVFVGDGRSNTFMLSGYGGYDLGIYLYDDQFNLVEFSDSVIGTSERFNALLASGRSYYLLVSAYDTRGQTSSYTLAIYPGLGSGGGAAGFEYWLLPLVFRLFRRRK